MGVKNIEKLCDVIYGRPPFHYRTCNEHACLTNCGAMTVLDSKLSKVEMNSTTSRCPGNIEAACR